MEFKKELEDKINLLRRKRIVITTPRLIILEYLLQNKVHPTAEEVYQSLKQRFPSLSLASVYNTLKLFSRLGITTELLLDKEKARYDINTIPHAHFKCLNCGKIYDLLDIKLPQKVTGHKVLSTQLYFYGVCQECLKKRSNK
ncbi:MAG: transcriptional repressor [Candidatus Desulfofervidus auxilii]|nr:transcriptional repressor [Candidatus Desulfofervidus auxilii]